MLGQTLLKKNLYLIIIGTMMGFLLYLSPGAFFIFLLAFISLILIIRQLDETERKFIITLFIIGFLLRIIICALFHLLSALYNIGIGYGSLEYPVPDLFADSGAYSLRGWFTAQYLQGKLKDVSSIPPGWREWLSAQYLPEVKLKDVYSIPPSWLFKDTGYGYNFIIYTIFYSFFGFAQLSAKFINCFLGVLSAIFIYLITKEAFNKSVAKMTSFLTMFFPSLFLWSLTNLKEPPTIFLLCAITLATIKFHRCHKLRYIFLILIFISLIELIRPTLSLTLFAGLFFSLLLGMKKKTVWKILIVVTLFILITNIFGYNLFLIGKDLVIETLKRMIDLQRGFVSEGGSTYKIYEERFYSGRIGDIRPLGFLVSFIKGWIYFLFVPFPWSIHTKLQLISYPQVVLWYLLVPFSTLGILPSIRYGKKVALVILIYIFFITSSFALVSGNIGTVLRHRDLVLPFYFVFAAAGLAKALGKKIEFQN